MKKIFSLIIVLSLLLAIGVSAFAVTVNMTVNQDIGTRGLYTVSAGETIERVTWTETIPDGLKIENDDNSIYLKGTPTSAGNYSFTLFIKVIESDGSEVTRNVDVSGNISSNIVITPDPFYTSTPTATPSSSPVATAFTITKQPGAENRTSGAYAIFIAKASGATNATWTLVATDGGQYSVDTFKTKFPNITVTVDNNVVDDVLTSTITLNNVTTAVSGYSAFVTFTNASGSILTSNSASMTITAATATPAATRTPTPTTAPTTKPTATVAPTTAPTVAPTSDPNATASPVPTDSPEAGSSNSEVMSHRSSNVGAIIATVFVGLLTVTIAVVLILYVQGKLDLSWLENKLESRHNRDDDDDK